jgi:hypothetical protein
MKTKEKIMEGHLFIHATHVIRLFTNENKSISNNVMKCNAFLLHGNFGESISPLGHHRWSGPNYYLLDRGDPNLVHNVEKRILKAIQNDKMIKQPKNKAFKFKPMQYFKHVQ